MMCEYTQASVAQVVPLTDSILQLILKPDNYIDYQAGQYLQIIFEGEAFSYSIANAPCDSHHYELHIRHSLDNVNTQRLLTAIKEQGRVNIRLPLGDCHLSRLDALKPILFIAGGTGFAPIKAMIEQLLASGQSRPLELFWGARSRSDLYLEAMVKRWQSDVHHLTYFSLISAFRKETLASMVLVHHLDDLADWQIVINGPPEMVFSTRDTLVANGVRQEMLFSDAFTVRA